MEKKQRWIGIDGGGSKTSAVIGDNSGNILAYARKGSTNIQSISFNVIKYHFKNLIYALLNETDTQITELNSIFISSAGGDRAVDKNKILLALDFIDQNNIDVFIDNDALAALASGSFGDSGMVLIAGTGSIAYNFSSDFKKISRVGGWGYIFGDEGSGFDIGRKAITSVLKQLDGRGKETVLSKCIERALDLNNLEEIVPYFYQNHQIRSEVAKLSNEVFKAAIFGDEVAYNIVSDALDCLTTLVGKIRESSQEKQRKPLIICGGLFNNEWFKEKFYTKLITTYDDLKIAFPQLSPVIGSYIIALKYSGISITSEIKKNLLNSYETYMV